MFFKREIIEIILHFTSLDTRRLAIFVSAEKKVYKFDDVVDVKVVILLNIHEKILSHLDKKLQ